jgi:hypothetical protein
MLQQQKMLSNLVVLPLAILYGLVVDPLTGKHGIPCLWHTLFGYTCPGCGLTRAWALLLRGDFHQAARMNWLVFPVLALYLGHLGLTMVRSTRTSTFKAARPHRILNGEQSHG